MTSKNRFRRKNKDALVTDTEKQIEIVQQEKNKKEEEERKPKSKPGKTYKVTSLGETDCSFCLKVIEAGNSFVTKNLSSPYLPSVVE